MLRTRCGSCGSSVLQPFLDLGSTPLADAFPRTHDEAETFYPLGLLVCHGCWLVQNTCVVPDDLLYGADYGFYTGASPSSIRYFADYAAWAIERFAPKFVVEIASNDGTLLRHFENGAAILGVEPSDNVARQAIEDGVPTLMEPFGRKTAQFIDEPADLIIANNVVAHVSDLDDFLGGIAILLADKGTALIEFQNVADLLLGNQFDHVYHEHRSFFSVASLERALVRHGLHIHDSMQTPAQGGSVRAIVRHGDSEGLWAPDAWLLSPAAYGGFQGRIDYLRDRIVDLVGQRDGPVAGYGASAKSTTLLNYCNLGPDVLTHVEDMTPRKVGRFTPGTKIPIRWPDDEERPDTFLLLTWNYLPGILRREREYRDNGGKFIVPIPQPVVL